MDQENTSYHDNNLEGLPKKSGMKVPDGYFKNFDKMILERIESESKNEKSAIQVPHKVGNNTVYRIGLSIAVAASLVWAMFTFLNTPTLVEQQDLVAEITLDEVLEYEDLNDYFFAEGFTLTELDSLAGSNGNNLTSEDLYAYIVEENYSEYLLIETY